MPYPDQVARAQTTPSTSLDPQRNGTPGRIGNAHTQRETTDSQGAIDAGGLPMPPYDVDATANLTVGDGNPFFGFEIELGPYGDFQPRDIGLVNDVDRLRASTATSAVQFRLATSNVDPAYSQMRLIDTGGSGVFGAAGEVLLTSTGTVYSIFDADVATAIAGQSGNTVEIGIKFIV